MTSPFDFSRRSSLSTTSYSLAAPSLPRPPIYNPYDKFTQPEFDAWIGGITGALKRALGQEDEAEQQPISQLSDSDESYGEVESQLREPVTDEESVDDEVNDSFAEIRARRVVGKGKARDPREGPGFGTGERHQPIEIVSDSEDEEEQENEEESEEEEEASEEWDEEEQSEEEEKVQPWSKPESSAQARIRHAKEQLVTVEDEEYEDEYEEDAYEEAEKSGQDIEDESDLLEVQEQHKSLSPIMVLDSDEEQGEEDEEDEEGSPVYEYVNEEELEAGYSDEDESTSLLISPIIPAVAPPRHQAATYNRHTYENGLAYPEHETSDDVEEDEIEEDIQPLSQAFPLYPSATQEDHAVEIPDPWEGRKTYSEDYFSGGDIPSQISQEFTADRLGAGSIQDVDVLPSHSHLESDATGNVIDIGVGKVSVDEVDRRPPVEAALVDVQLEPSTDRISHNLDLEEIVEEAIEEDEQPLAEDTSFPPAQPSEEPDGVNIPDPWLMPSRFAEDFYAGGDVRPGPDGELSPHHLGTGDEDVSSTSPDLVPPHDVVEVVDEEEQQMADDTSFPPPQPDENLVPVNIPDPWLMPRRLAEDYYAGGDVRPGPDSQLDPHHLNGDDQGAIPMKAPSPVGNVEVVEEVVEDDEQQQQPVAEDTSFPPPLPQPSSPQTQYPVELPDPWYGPRTYAEDYYAGGDIRPSADGQLSPDRLGAGDVGEPPILVDSKQGFVLEITKDQDAQPMVSSPSREPALFSAGDHEELDLNGLYDDMQVDAGAGHVDLSGVDWEYASEFLNGVSTSAMDQFMASDIGGDFNRYGESAEGEDNVPQSVKAALEDEHLQAESAIDNVATLRIEVSDQTIGQEAEAVVLVPEAQFTPTSEVSNEVTAEAVIFIEEAIASVEEASPSPEPSSTTSTPVFVQTTSPENHHYHAEYGLPTPPSEHEPAFERPSSPQQGESQDLSTSVGPEPTLAVESSGESVSFEAIVTNASCNPIIEEVAEEEDGGADEDADGEIDLDVDRVSPPIPGMQTSLTQETLVETESSSIQECDATMVAHVTKDLTVDTMVPVDEPALSVATGTQVSASSPPDLEVGQLDEAAALDTGSHPGLPVHPALESDSQPSPSQQETMTMPVCADPTIPDPTSRPQTPTTGQPLILSLPGTPNFMLSPAGTPGDRPTPVSVPISPSVLQALRMHHVRPAAGPSGLFTPIPVPDLDDATPVTAPTQVEELPPVQEGTEPEAPLTESAMPVGETELQPEQFILGEPQNAVSTESETPPATTAPLLEEIADDGATTSTPSTSMPQLLDAGLTPSTSTPKPSLSHNAPSSYPMRVVMRKATDPILFSDPYPYSLSTPGEFLDDAKDVELYEEDTSQDNSTSSSSQDNSIASLTGDKDLDNKENNVILTGLGAGDEEDVESIENMELRYPSVQPNGQEPAKPITHADDSVTDDLHNDTDADGDLDPDFVVSPMVDRVQEPTLALAPQETEPQVSVSVVDTNGRIPLEAPPPKSEELVGLPRMGEEIRSLRTTPVSSLTSVPPTKASDAQAPSPRADRELPAILIIKKRPVLQLKRKEAAHNEESEELTDLDDQESPAKPKSSRPSKRKRSSSVTNATSPLTRSMSSKKVDARRQNSRSTTRSKNGVKQDIKKTNGIASVSMMDKGKSKEVRALQASNTSFDTRSISSRSSSGASTASRMLHPDSRNTSRASSIISTAPSDKSSLVIQPSPTLDKGVYSRSQAPPPAPPPSLLHRHSHALPHHHHHRAPSAQPPPPQQPRPQKASSFTHPSEPHPAADAAASKPSTSSQPGPSHRAPVSFSSPVTRSHCRYHKISIPREEDGPRLFFLVPGCSLGNRELIKEEEILDHGDATPEDGLRIVQDLDSLDFDPYLIGVLRLLCGVDLFAQDVYYVAQPGPELVPKKRRKAENSSAARVSSRDVVHAGDHASPISAASLRSPTSSRAPVSTAGSASTSASAPRRTRDWERDSLSVLSFSEGELSEDEYHPRSKRTKPSPADGKPAIGNMGPPTSDQKPRKLKARGSMRKEDESQSSRRGKGTHGVKRSRTSEIARESEADARKVKKQKTATSDHWKP